MVSCAECKISKFLIRGAFIVHFGLYISSVGFELVFENLCSYG